MTGDTEGLIKRGARLYTEVGEDFIDDDDEDEDDETKKYNTEYVRSDEHTQSGHSRRHAGAGERRGGGLHDDEQGHRCPRDHLGHQAVQQSQRTVGARRQEACSCRGIERIVTCAVRDSRRAVWLAEGLLGGGDQGFRALPYNARRLLAVDNCIFWTDLISFEVPPDDLSDEL